MPADQTEEIMKQLSYSGEMHVNGDKTWDMSLEMHVMGRRQTISGRGTWVLENGEIILTATEQDGMPREEPDVRKCKYEDGRIWMDYGDDVSGLTMTFTLTKK